MVTKENNLVAAIELKSQSGSFGNNLNNRSEEILGLARDFWTAYRERAYRILCERLILERDYSATALLASPKDSRDGKFIEPSGELTLYKFSKSLFAHLVAYC